MLESSAHASMYDGFSTIYARLQYHPFTARSWSVGGVARASQHRIMAPHCLITRDFKKNSILQEELVCAAKIQRLHSAGNALHMYEGYDARAGDALNRSVSCRAWQIVPVKLQQG